MAANTNGLYASIDQHAAAVANVATPFDARLAELNDELNATYVAFGAAGERGRANQLAQDGNAAAMSPAAAASRAVAKAGELYRAEWDLVDAVQSGKALADISAAELPAELQALPPAEREAYVRDKSERREDLQRQVGELAAERSRYIAEQTAELPSPASTLRSWKASARSPQRRASRSRPSRRAGGPEFGARHAQRARAVAPSVRG